MLRSLPLPFKKAFTNANKAREMSAQLVNEHKRQESQESQETSLTVIWMSLIKCVCICDGIF